MTREEAARVLRTLMDAVSIYDVYDWHEAENAFDVAIDALREPQLDDNGLSRCAWCGPERIGWFSVQFWVRSCYGKRKWMSVTQDWKKKVKHCPMCGRKLSEVEG